MLWFSFGFSLGADVCGDNTQLGLETGGQHLPNSETDTLDSVDNDENVIGGKLGELGKVREREREREREGVRKGVLH